MRFNEKIHVFALLYGDYHDIHARLIRSLVQTDIPEDVNIWFWLNQVCEKTQDYLGEHSKPLWHTVW